MALLPAARPVVISLVLVLLIESTAGSAPVALAAPATPAAPAPTSHSTPTASSGETTEIVSVSSRRGRGNGQSHEAFISADGRYVTFESTASTLVDGDTNATADVFVHDRHTGITTRVSVASDGSQGNGSSEDPTISPDGRYIAFRSAATNLVASDTNNKYDIFRHDRSTGATIRVSVDSSGSQVSGSSDSAIVSAGGAVVTFRSFASDLVAGDTNSVTDIFVRDVAAGTTSRVSVDSSGTQADGASDGPALSDDGTLVAFDSAASNLVASDTNAVVDAFVHDRGTGTTVRVSVAAGGGQSDGASWEPSLSGDGTRVAFTSSATNLVSGDTNAKDDVFVVTRATGAIIRASVASAGTQSNNHADETSLSADGALLAFYSTASNLVGGDTNVKGDIFVRDLVNGTTVRKSVAHDGAQGDDRSANPAISGDGRTVAFHSFAENLVPGDTNSVGDVFARGFPRPANLGLQPQFSTESWDLGAGDDLAVNAATGNLVVSHPLVTLPFRGSALPIDLTYNSHDATDVGLGPGWRLNLQRRLLLNLDNSITFIDADGARHTFSAPQTSGSVTTYTRPPTLYASLVRDTAQTAEFSLTWRDQSVDTFDIAGGEALLVRAEDRFANGVDLAYSGSTANLSSVTDPAGRQVTFTWDTAPTPDRLSSISDWSWIDGSGVVQTTNSGSRRTYRFFYDADGRLAGWSDPLNTSGSCPSGGSQLTCLTYGGGMLTTVTKTQTVTTFGSGALGTATRAISTEVSYGGVRVASVTDAEQVAQASPARTTFSLDSATQTTVARPTTTKRYVLVAADDPYARVESVFRVLDATTAIERRTAWDTAFPIEPASVTDNAGALLSAPARTLSFTYVANSLGLLAKLVEPLTASTNRWTEHSYNANNDVTQTVVSQDGSSTLRTATRFCYDVGCSLSGAGLSLLRQIENYVSGGASDEDTNVATDFGSDAYGQRTSVTRHNRDAAGAVLDDREDRFVFDATGNLTAAIMNYANGTVTSPGDDVTPNATTLTRTDLTTVHTFDTAGNLVSSADPRRAVEAAAGTTLGADDFVNRSTYDGLNQRLTDTTPTTPSLSSNQRTASSTYDELGLLRTAADFGGLVTATSYDRAGRAVQTFEDPDPGAAYLSGEATYDADGKPLNAKDQRQLSDTSLGSTSYAYDALGRTTSITSGDGSAAEAEDRSTYDGLDRRTTLEVGFGSASSLLTTYTHDLGGRAIATDDGFACTTETFDYRDLLTGSTSGLAAGCTSAADTRTLAHTHDGLGRLARSEVTAGADLGDRTADITFDAAGNPRTQGVRTGGVTSTTTLALGLIDQVISEARADGSTAKTTYDAAGNAIDRCYWKPGIAVGACHPVGSSPWTDPPTQVTTTTFDARNQRISLEDAAAESVTTYDPDHNYAVAAVYRATANGREHQALYTHDARHRLSGITFQTCTANGSHVCTGTPVSTGSDSYAYDDNDNRTQVVENNAAASSDRRYCYDARNQLTYRNTGAACSSSVNDETFSYDDAGNRLSATTSGGTANFAYDASGLLCDEETGSAASCTAGNVSHDTAGRIESWAGWTFGYDAESRLTSACKSATCAPGFDKLTFVYDGEGHRTDIVATSAGGTVTTTEFRYHGDAVSAEVMNGSVVREFVTDESGAITKLIVPAGQPDAGTYLVTWNGHGDALNLLRVNADGTTTLANSFTYDTWGTPTTATHSGIGDLGFRYLYVGQFDVQWDDSLGLSLQYMHARHYVPALGRFLQPDPSGLDRMTFAYTANNPVTRSDPSGAAWISVVWTRLPFRSIVYGFRFGAVKPFAWVAVVVVLQRRGAVFFWWDTVQSFATRAVGAQTLGFGNNKVYGGAACGVDHRITWWIFTPLFDPVIPNTGAVGPFRIC